MTTELQQSKMETPPKADVARTRQVSVFGTVRRFLEELEPEETASLVIGGCAMVVNATTNMLYPRIIGTIIDSGSTGKVFGPGSWIPGIAQNLPHLDDDEIQTIGCPYAMFKRLLFSALPLYAAGSLASWLRVSSMKRAIYLIQKRSRKKMYKKLLMQGAPFFHTRASSLLISKLLNDCEEGPKSMVENAFMFLRCCNSVIGGTFNLISISPCLTGLTMTCIPFFGLFVIGYSSIIKRCHRRLKDMVDLAIGQADEVISSIESVMSFGKEADEIDAFSHSLDNCDAIARGVCNSEGVFMGSVLAGFNLSTLLMLYCGSYKMKSGDISAGNLASFILYGGLFGLGVSGLSKIASEVSKAAVSMQRVYEIHDLEEIEDAKATLESVRGSIEFENVSFSYDARSEMPVLRDFNLKIEAGEVLAIVGANGMGKSTAAALLTTLYRPTRGRILLDGVDLCSLSSRWLRSKVFTVVTQEPLLFSMSIEDNLLYGNEDLTDEQLREATRMCDVHDFIESLPDKYRTVVGRRGSLLSTGQKQRLALARALLRDTPCVILDEATSSIDGSSEELVRCIVNRKDKRKTVIVITHHAATLRNVDKVAVLNEGRHGKSPVGGARVGIRVTISDSYHLSGGPFCCFVRVAPIASNWSDSDAPVTIDFISLNVYGLASFRDLPLQPSKLQNTLHFGFLNEARRGLKIDESAHLIFASDAALFSTCSEIDGSSTASYYRYMCTIPPFLPPTVESENVSYKYYVYVTVQYSLGSRTPQRETLHRRLEFAVVGSVYPGIPTLDNVFYPFLPKSEGYLFEGGRVADAVMPKVCMDIIDENYGRDNMFFNYETHLDTLESDSEAAEVRNIHSTSKLLLTRDLNAFWHVWDTMNGSNLSHEPEESYVLRRYNGFIERFTNLILNDTTDEQFEQLRPWFGSMLRPDVSVGCEDDSPSLRREMLQMFYKEVEERHTQAHGATVETLRRAAGDALEVLRETPSDGSLPKFLLITFADSMKTLSFAFRGRRFCTCKLQGFGQLLDANEFTLPTNSWFTVSFDFPDAFLCLQVDVALVRCDSAGPSQTHSSERSVLKRSLFTLGKSTTSVTLYAPMDTAPTFTSSLLSVSYKLELCFHHFPEPSRCLRADARRAELSKLRMLRWDHPVRMLQSESLRVQSRCFSREESVSMVRLLCLAREVCERSNTSGLLRGALALSTTLTIN
ncbi:putative ATP-binding cassette [Babesia sp. Xinjiang]|uniref:putative ATP-binding cassette n=1 Tax=Babesia sp. Xinjiang TaxID=462227 RepID=UPI000A22537D|nr:putative ATP-binding cassette [Babesia sp. Xinjiang]ORM39676.1 putative ATP-binding cassette [Babesia sp. Xinjiang]